MGDVIRMIGPILASIALAACAGTPRPPPVPPAGLAEHGLEDCTEHLLVSVAPRMPAEAMWQPADARGRTTRAAPERPRPPRYTNGVVVLAFDLDGSGGTSNIRLVSEQPAGLYGVAAAEAVSQFRYTADIVRRNCAYTISFEWQRQ